MYDDLIAEIIQYSDINTMNSTLCVSNFTNHATKKLPLYIECARIKSLDFDHSIKHGSLPLVKYFYIGQDTKAKFADVCFMGHIEVAKWLYKLNALYVKEKHLEIFRYTCYEGQLEVAQWLHSIYPINLQFEKSIFEGSCYHGKLDVAQWLYSCGIKINKGCVDFLATFSRGRGYPDVYNWLHSLNL